MPTKIGRTEYVTATEAAEMLAVKLATFTAYVNRGTFRAHPAIIAGRRFWKQTDVAKFRDNRPGPGARTDLKKAGKK
jgi:hypothetical protein